MINLGGFHRLWERRRGPFGVPPSGGWGTLLARDRVNAELQTPQPKQKTLPRPGRVGESLAAVTFSSPYPPECAFRKRAINKHQRHQEKGRADGAFSCWLCIVTAISVASRPNSVVNLMIGFIATERGVLERVAHGVADDRRGVKFGAL